MNVRTVRLAMLTGVYLIAIVLFLILRLVDHYSIFTSLFVTGIVLFGFTFAWFLAGGMAVKYETMREKQTLDKEAPEHE
ncbi:hypothetical protein RU820_05320 [Acidithiobacillus ferrooxidans]|nr:hypothetical protein [Acidithiobacillus ferrooxidans]